ncbi:DedA family protein [Amaricoccus solimangrovi]|uniref:DedA family protein n=1 Tax=Amaricoccus solimangrovi TaxID=2589815 RepID=A0A501WVW3_9RHOB|nr:DedA family protein [Amaricoccus solimangrovi]TPE52560.1 DedA family protein [Amaricoccus solimangrovi]
MSAFAATIEGLLAHYGAAALFLVVTLESFGAPLPGESAVIAASAAAAAGKLPLAWVAVATFAGAVLGDNIGYLIGRDLGRPVILRHGARFGVTEGALARVEDIMRRRGPIIVVVARFVALLRQLNGLVAGTTGMPWPRFLAANMLGAALWTGFWVTLAYKLGREADVLPWIWHHLGLIASVVAPLLILGLVVAGIVGRRRG